MAAHTAMFQSTSNDGYYELGLRTANVVRDAVTLDWGVEVMSTNKAGMNEGSQKESSMVDKGAPSEPHVVNFG